MKLDTILNADLSAAGAQARDLEAAGFDGVFTYEGPSDVFFPLVAATATDLDLYTNVAIALPRSPMHLATQSWDLQRASGGRFALGVGSQIKPHIERRYSAVWDRPVAQMRDLIRATKAIFTSWQEQTPLHYEGEYYTHTLQVPPLTPTPLESAPPPIWAGALGPVMTRMVAAEADGVIIHPFNSRHFLDAHTIPRVQEGWAEAGRDGADFNFGVGAMIGVYRDDQEQEAAMTAVRFNLGFYGSTPAYRVVLDAHGWGDLQPELRRLTKEGRWTELGAVWDDEMIATLATVGTPAEVTAELRRRYGGVADRISISAPQQPPVDLLGALADAWAATA